jgi:copper chaperone
MTNQKKTLTIAIEGMSCNHCKKAVEDALKTLDGVYEANVNLEANNATVTFEDNKVTEKHLKEAIINAGYEVK